MKLIIADTGPLIHLLEAQALDLLPTIGEIFVTPQVLREWQNQPVELRPSIPKWLTLLTPSANALRQADSWVESGLLQMGEAESLAVAVELKPDWFLTDDTAARELARSLGVESHGSLGVVLWIAGQGGLSQAEAASLIDRLEHSSLWLSDLVRAEVRRLLRELFPNSSTKP